MKITNLHRDFWIYHKVPFLKGSIREGSIALDIDLLIPRPKSTNREMDI